MRRYQEQNPYYHYYYAVAAYNSGDLDSAQRRLTRAIELKDNDHRFYRLQGLIAEHRGDRRVALESFEHALDLAVYSDARRMYDDKISLLNGRR